MSPVGSGKGMPETTFAPERYVMCLPGANRHAQYGDGVVWEHRRFTSLSMTSGVVLECKGEIYTVDAR